MKPCQRCGGVKPREQFTKYGDICLQCKRVAVLARDVRETRGKLYYWRAKYDEALIKLGEAPPLNMVQKILGQVSDDDLRSAVLELQDLRRTGILINGVTCNIARGLQRDINLSYGVALQIVQNDLMAMSAIKLAEQYVCKEESVLENGMAQ